MSDPDAMQKLVDAMQKLDTGVSFMDKIAILAALGYTQDILKGKHGEEAKALCTKEIGRAFVARIVEWKMETK